VGDVRKTRMTEINVLAINFHRDANAKRATTPSIFSIDSQLLTLAVYVYTVYIGCFSAR
jgi:hypothetical protein